MNVAEELSAVQVVVDAERNKTAALLDYALWEELIEMFEGLEDDEEITRLRDENEESVPREEAKAQLRIERTRDAGLGAP